MESMSPEPLLADLYFLQSSLLGKWKLVTCITGWEILVFTPCFMAETSGCIMRFKLDSGL